jgi:hypothetical protein
MQNASNEEDEDCYQVRDNRRVNWRLICHAGGQCVGQVKSALNSAARWPSPPPVPFSCGFRRHAAGRAKWSVAERSVTGVTGGRRLKLGVAFRNRADSAGATNDPLWPDHLGGTRAPSDGP